NVFLPKFKMTAKFELSRIMATLGMKDAFTGNADFSGMDGQRDLAISAILHKAFVDVNEEGTEAAAATAVVMKAMAMLEPEPPAVLRADHPFLFLIRERSTGSILFLGRIADPTQPGG
ncbi:MAG: serpin family protein, partial [Kiritimatiellaeota bacterium]|nr:serpin family protein [Kiritimatiellota bacterium]